MQPEQEQLREKVYEAPQLRELGTLQELTRGQGGTGHDAMGGYSSGELGPNRDKQ